MRYSIATSWDNELLEKIEGLNNTISKNQIKEIYGSFPKAIIGCGRPGNFLPQITQEQFENHIKLAQKKGLDFNYTLNSPSFDFTSLYNSKRKKLISFLTYLEFLGTDVITISNYDLAVFISNDFDFEIVVSCIANVNSINKFNKWRNIKNVKRINLPHSKNRDFPFLRDLKNKSDVEIELIANETCLFDCAYRDYHYSHVGHFSEIGCDEKNYIDLPMMNCTIDKLEDLSELLKARWIRPENIQDYVNYGINYIKITDRTLPLDFLCKCAEAYMKNSYNGNLVDILSLTPHYFADCLNFPRIYIDNNKLSHFLDIFLMEKCGNNCEKCTLCDSWKDQVMEYNIADIDRYLKILKRSLRKYTICRSLK